MESEALANAKMDLSRAQRRRRMKEKLARGRGGNEECDKENRNPVNNRVSKGDYLYFSLIIKKNYVLCLESNSI